MAGFNIVAKKVYGCSSKMDGFDSTSNNKIFKNEATDH